MVPFGQTNHEDFKKYVQILLEMRSSFIWNSADGQYLIEVLISWRVCKLTTVCHDAPISICIYKYSYISIYFLLLILLLIGHNKSSKTAPEEERLFWILFLFIGRAGEVGGAQRLNEKLDWVRGAFATFFFYYYFLDTWIYHGSCQQTMNS